DVDAAADEVAADAVGRALGELDALARIARRAGVRDVVRGHGERTLLGEQRRHADIEDAGHALNPSLRSGRRNGSGPAAPPGRLRLHEAGTGGGCSSLGGLRDLRGGGSGERLAATDREPLVGVLAIRRAARAGAGPRVRLGVRLAPARLRVAGQAFDHVRVVREALGDAVVGAEVRAAALGHAADDLERPRARLLAAPRRARLDAKQVVRRAAVCTARN